MFQTWQRDGPNLFSFPFLSFMFCLGDAFCFNVLTDITWHSALILIYIECVYFWMWCRNMGYKSTEPVCQVLVSMMLSEQTDSYDTEHSLFLGQDCSIGHGLNGHIWSSHLHAYLHSSARSGGGACSLKLIPQMCLWMKEYSQDATSLMVQRPFLSSLLWPLSWLIVEINRKDCLLTST